MIDKPDNSKTAPRSYANTLDSMIKSSSVTSLPCSNKYPLNPKSEKYKVKLKMYEVMKKLKEPNLVVHIGYQTTLDTIVRSKLA